MPRAPGEGVEQRRAVTAVAAGEDVRRVRSPEEDSLAPQMRRPGFVDPGPVREQPTADKRLGQPRTLLARGSGREVAEPGKALQLLGQAAGRASPPEVEIPERKRLGPDRETTGEKRIAARPFAVDMVARNGGELQRLPRTGQPRQEGAASEFADDGALGGRSVVAHTGPLSALILSA